MAPEAHTAGHDIADASSPLPLEPRSGAVDLVRVLGITAVVAGHTLPFPFVRTLVYSWHVPVFFFLAGYFWSTHRALSREAATRMRTLLRPMLTWLVLIGVVFVLVDTHLEPDTWQRLAGPLTDGENSAMPFTTFWFVIVLFSSVLLLRLVWRLPRTIMWAVTGTALLLSLIAGPQLANTPLSVGSALPCTAFLALGYAARTVRPRISRPGLLGCALLVVSTLLVATGVALPLDIKQGDYGTPALSVLASVMISFGLVLTCEKLCEHLPAAVGRVATVLSYGGFMVVLTHPLVLWALTALAPPLPSWITFSLCLLVPWVLALCALRTRLSAWLTGVDQPTASFRAG
ncbi:acyltransferase family protein [Leifsonia sp. EB34]|uniref:acyltransferase family protein n=1 Tax=Leifsonia sp. EB34 TaxID=3156303 RepID=UPI003513F273